MKSAFAIACFCLAGCEGLRVAVPTVLDRAPLPEKQECVDDTHWGIWIDGRDAHHGENFYGATYGQTVDPVLKTVYARANENTKPGMELFREIADLVHEKFLEKNGWHGLTGAVSTCLATFDKDRFNEVMDDVVVMNKKFAYKHGATRGKQMTELFEEYNSRQELAVGKPEDQIMAIGFLVHNLAFAHPLRDHNGRSRLLLIQHELRRLGLGCGTMMYNNNRDMCFNTQTETAEKIKEGMEMYNTWQKTGVNGWTDPANQEKHLARFAVSKKLKSCWHKHGQTAPCGGRADCNHKGTSVE